MKKVRKNGLSGATAIVTPLIFLMSLATRRFIPAGFVFYGGLFGYMAVFIMMQKAAFGKHASVLCDSLAVVIPLFHGFGRIGCFFAQCCFGMLLGIPVQLVESGFNFLIFAMLLFLLLKNKFKGKLLGIYLSSYAAARFFLEFFRADAVRGMVGIFSFGQICSVAALLIASLFLTKRN